MSQFKAYEKDMQVNGQTIMSIVIAMGQVYKIICSNLISFIVFCFSNYLLFEDIK